MKGDADDEGASEALLAEQSGRNDAAVFLSVAVAALGPLSTGYALGYTR